MSQTDLYLIRHGQTNWNAERRIQGSTDTSALTDMGRAQAQKAGERLSALTVSAIYSSPMKRARETAQIISSFHGCQVFEEPYLHEGKFGKLEGLTVSEFEKQYEEEIQRRRQLPKEERLHHKYDEAAESTHEIVTRVIPALKRIALAHMGQNIIVVTHGLVIKSLLVMIGEFDEQGMMVANGGMVHLRGDGETFHLVKHEGITFKGAKL
jgi:broad specificity phosphatase PhoE